MLNVLNQNVIRQQAKNKNYFFCSHVFTRPPPSPRPPFFHCESNRDANSPLKITPPKHSPTQTSFTFCEHHQNQRSNVQSYFQIDFQHKHLKGNITMPPTVYSQQRCICCKYAISAIQWLLNVLPLSASHSNAGNNDL